MPVLVQQGGGDERNRGDPCHMAAFAAVAESCRVVVWT
jgi:hypothetical protein